MTLTMSEPTTEAPSPGFSVQPGFVRRTRTGTIVQHLAPKPRLLGHEDHHPGTPQGTPRPEKALAKKHSLDLSGFRRRSVLQRHREFRAAVRSASVDESMFTLGADVPVCVLRVCVLTPVTLTRWTAQIQNRV